MGELLDNARRTVACHMEEIVACFKPGVKITRTARISRRPSSMAAVQIHLEASGRLEKLPTGPMMGPRPGPTLVSEVSAPVMAVTKSRPVAASSTVKIAHRMKKEAMNSTTARCMSSSTVRSP